jgi:hypothetical protein
VRRLVRHRDELQWRFEGSVVWTGACRGKAYSKEHYADEIPKPRH